MTVTSRRQDWAARRRGELNRERGSRRLSPAINAPRRLTEGRPGGAWTKAGSAESQADPIGHLCPVCGSLLEPGGDLGETVGYRVIETRGSMWHSGASGAGQLIADRVGEIIAQRELKHARVRLEIERRDADCQPPSPAASARALGTGDDAAAPLQPQPRRRDCRASSKLSTTASSSLTVPPEEVRFALGGKLRTDMSSFERRGGARNATTCR